MESEQPKRKKRVWLWILLGVTIGLALAILFAVFFSSSLYGEPEEAVLASETVAEDAEAADTQETPAEDAPPEEPQHASYFESNDGFVTGMDIVQVMAKCLDADSGMLYSMENIVAGKDTLVAVTFAEPTEILTDGSMKLSVSRNGTFVTDLLPINSGTEDTVLFAPKAFSDVNGWAAGEYTFAFSYGDSQAVKTVSILAATPIKVLGVPVLGNFGGEVQLCGEEWKTALAFTEECYPLPKGGVEYVLSPTLDLSGSEYDLNTDDGRYNVWQALVNLQTPDRDYELILGFVAQAQGSGEKQSAGYTFGWPANIINTSDGDMQATVAHEIAHCYNVGDEYETGFLNINVNPAPYGTTGIDWSNSAATVTCDKEAVRSSLEFGKDNCGSAVYPEQLPFNVTQMEPLDRVGSFMGYGSYELSDYWITSDIWNQLYKAFVYHSVTYALDAEYEESDGLLEASHVACPSCYAPIELAEVTFFGLCEHCFDGIPVNDDDLAADGFTCLGCGKWSALTEDNLFILCPQCNQPASVAELQESLAQVGLYAGMKPEKNDEHIYALDIAGTVGKDDAFTPMPWFAYEADGEDIPLQLTGEYSAEFFDVNGASISRQYFDVSFVTKCNPPIHFEKVPMSITVRYPDDAAAIRLLHGEKEIYRTRISDYAPEVSFSGLSEGQTLTGKQEIKWTGSDCDGDKLTYELWYCTQKEEFFCVGSNLADTKCLVDFDDLPGDGHAYFYLYANDGVNTMALESPEVNVPYKAPEIISRQESVQSYAASEEIRFIAEAYDIQDGWLCDADAIGWWYNGSLYMGGDTLWVHPYELASGEHTFTLKAVNSQGKTASRDFTFRITEEGTDAP